MKKSPLIALFLLSVFVSHAQKLVVLGTLQDGGSPHMLCEKECCSVEIANDFVSCLGLIDENDHSYFFDATPDFVNQSRYLLNLSGNDAFSIFLTHAHMGHYSGLIHLGREASSANGVPVYAMPRMGVFLSENGPWDQLVNLDNIEIKGLVNGQEVKLTNSLSVTPLLVPHRDEYSETVGYQIKGAEKTALFIPDIDKWDLWDRDIVTEIQKVAYVFLDATFMKEGEVARPMSEVPHPFIEESVALFGSLTLEQRNKIYFIHLNHSNPARVKNSADRVSVEALGFHFAEFGQTFEL
jgi:pyrroloquinoline quinone biosynthesis protein B